MVIGTQLINNNWRSAECTFYGLGSAIAVEAAAASVVTFQYWGLLGSAAVGFAFDYAANLAGCQNNPDNPTPAPPQNTGCQKASSGTLSVVLQTRVGTADEENIGVGFGMTEILSTQINEDYAPGQDQILVTTTGGPQGEVIETLLPQSRRPYGQFISTLSPGGVCETPFPEPEPLPPDAIGSPSEYEFDGCNWTFTPYDSFIDGTGAVQVYWVVSADDPLCGGPFAYWSGPTGPTYVNPNPPDESPDPILPPPVADDRDTDDIEKELEEIKEQLDIIQQCACGDPKPVLLGDWVSIRFVSDGDSPNGLKPLRKLFRYRSQSSRTVQQLRDYWAGFTWEAGSVIVQHKGTWWGTPQVWASSVEEGKRVIRFAATEAGAYPDEDGQWIVTGTAAARYGMPGIMRIQKYQGLDWITARNGPSGPVEL